MPHLYGIGYEGQTFKSLAIKAISNTAAHPNVTDTSRCSLIGNSRYYPSGIGEILTL